MIKTLSKGFRQRVGIADAILKYRYAVGGVKPRP